jgi:hypothetical protein
MRCESVRLWHIAVELRGANSTPSVFDISGIVLARLRPAHLLLSLPCALDLGMRRIGNSMFELKRKLLAVAIGCLLTVGVYAQKQGGDKRPPKDPDTRVVVQPKGEKPPQNNNNRGDKRGGDKKGKP